MLLFALWAVATLFTTVRTVGATPLVARAQQTLTADFEEVPTTPLGLPGLLTPVPNGYRGLNWENLNAGSKGPLQRILPNGQKFATGPATGAALSIAQPTRYIDPQSIFLGCYVMSLQGNAALPQKCTIRMTATTTAGRKLTPVDFRYTFAVDALGIAVNPEQVQKYLFPSSWKGISRLDFLITESATPSAGGVSVARLTIDDVVFTQHTAAKRRVVVSPRASTLQTADFEQGVPTVPLGLSNALLNSEVPSGYKGLDWVAWKGGSKAPAQRMNPDGEVFALTTTGKAGMRAKAPTRSFDPLSIGVGCFTFTLQGNGNLPQRCTMRVTATDSKGRKFAPVNFEFDPPLDVGGLGLNSETPQQKSFPTSWKDVTALDFELVSSVTPAAGSVSTVGMVIDNFRFLQHTAAAAREVEVSARAQTQRVAGFEGLPAVPFGLSNAALPNPVPNGYMDLDWETFRVGSIGPAQRLIPIGERLAVTGFTTDAAIKARAPTRFFRPQSIAVGCYLYTGQGNAALPQKCTITVTATNTRGQKLSPVDFVFEPPLDVGGVSLATTPPLKNNFPSSWTRDDIVRLDFALKEAVTPSVAGVSTAGYVIDEFAFVQHTAAAAREVEISASASTRELADFEGLNGLPLGAGNQIIRSPIPDGYKGLHWTTFSVGSNGPGQRLIANGERFALTGPTPRAAISTAPGTRSFDPHSVGVGCYTFVAQGNGNFPQRCTIRVVATDTTGQKLPAVNFLFEPAENVGGVGINTMTPQKKVFPTSWTGKGIIRLDFESMNGVTPQVGSISTFGYVIDDFDFTRHT